MKPIPTLPITEDIPKLLYFGCHRQPGHFFFEPGMVSAWRMPQFMNQIDTPFAPQDTSKQGEAWYHIKHVNGLTYNLISFWDNSVDTRPGSHSSFIIIGRPMSFNEAITLVREKFPEVFSRFKFEVKLVRNVFMHS